VGEKSIDSLFDLTDRVALITGGTGMLGSLFARTMAGYGADIVLIDVDRKMCDSCATQIATETGRRVFGIRADVTDAEDVKRAVRFADETFGRIDILVNNAAAQPEGMFSSVEDYPIDVWNRVMAVNLTAQFLMSRTVAPAMLRRKKGSIVNISSIYGVVAPDQRVYEGLPFNSPPVYSASKAGVLGLTRYLAAYWGSAGIRVNSITPGGVFQDHEDPFLSKYTSRVPMGRMAGEGDLAGAMLYLASDAAGYVTGHNLVVDGGLTVW
jgi:NAD(P)-dependent dehydrogenase (short-subunit alcohol dehydrogenase family)